MKPETLADPKLGNFQDFFPGDAGAGIEFLDNTQYLIPIVNNRIIQ